MVAAIAIQVPLLVLPMLQISPTRDCRLEVLTPQAMADRALSEFNVSAEHYATLHRRRARALPMPPAVDDEDPFAADDLRAVIVAARPNVRAGMFFTPQVGIRLKERIETVFLYHPGAVADAVIRGGYEPIPGEPGPVVNQPFPRVAASVRWPPLARALPALPPELDFALWGRDLVLLDVAANLVLDVLPDALPPAAQQEIVYQ